ncbi:glycosyltransferase family 4 protein [Phenylobacterium aquaticum]|uniref:glycosyltransferase family 4 protein n=1 Tax=Phenylobacterium aquaticum TaxID=1763816 RepID=UPI0026EBB069|nr:glycosyltransferase family 4 protein [Phenylobacterium aquaticum]
MSNAAFYLHPDGYNTATGELMGRHSAGESFLRGFIRNADVDHYHFYNVTNRPPEEMRAFVNGIEQIPKPQTWIARHARHALAEPGVLNMPIPEIGHEAWMRWPTGRTAYSICGITHTTATAAAMRAIGELITSPTEAWDAMICTSRAVRASVETELEAIRDYHTWQFGPRQHPEAQRATIPLGVNTSDFAADPGHRKAWREKLNIPDDAVVALYVGRFDPQSKMNPALMALALERACAKTGKTLYWVAAGWGADALIKGGFHDQIRALCPSVEYREVDGRPPETRFSIWSVADFFLSLSDNIQETFGLTPIEAMSAGLPCVVTDWDGYRDTVRHERDGFRIPTYAPRAGTGQDLSFAMANHWIDYRTYVAAAAQSTAIDLDAAATAIARLATHPELRRSMGATARAQAVAVFDWAQIIPQYQALWSELQARRLAAPPAAPIPPSLSENPWHMDPFRLFSGYPTEVLTPSTEIRWTPTLTVAAAEAVLATPLARIGRVNFPTAEETHQTLVTLSGRSPMTAGELASGFPPSRRPFVERGLLWLAKFGVIEIIGRKIELT